MGGHTATVGWLRSRTDTFHADVHLLEAVPPAAMAPGSAGSLRWLALEPAALPSAAAGPDGGTAAAAAAAATGAAPAAREYHTLTALADGRVLMFGGACVSKVSFTVYL